MSAIAKDLAGLVIALAVTKKIIPDGEDLLGRIPKHYFVGKYAHSALPINQGTIQSIPDQPARLLDVSWPIQKIYAASITCLDWVETSTAALSLLVEKAVRGDTDSSVLMAEKNLEALKEQNVVYEKELQKLTPIADLIMRIIKAAEHATGELALENLEIAEKIKLKEKQVQDITEALQTINIETVMEALEKITAAAQKALANPSFIEDLSIDIERLEEAEQELNATQASLKQTEALLQEKVSYLEELRVEAQDLGLQQEEVFKQIQAKVVDLVEKTQSQHPSIQTKVIYDNSAQAVY